MADDQPGQTIYEDQVSGSASSVPKGAVNVLDNGATIVEDALSINFLTGASVADGGDGQANVTATGVTTYVGLTDTPGGFGGDGGQFVKVNAGETALEHVAGETIDDLPVQTGLDSAADKVAVWDDSAGDTVYSLLQDLPSVGGGETNLGANLGAGVGVFETKSGVTLQFNSLVSQTTALTIGEDDPNDEIDFTIADVIAAGASGLMTGADKTKLDGVAAGATDDTTVDAHIADAVGAHDDSAIAAAASATNYTPSASTVEGHLAGIDTALGTAGAVDSVFGRTGAVVAVSGDYDDAEVTAAASATNYTPSAATVDGHLSGIDTALGTAGAVDSVFGRTGAVVAVSGDYDADEITETASNKIMTAAERTKLTGIETGATADQTGAEIKVAYEGEANTNAFTDAEQTKLTGIEAGANAPPFVTGDYQDASVTLAKIQDIATDSFIGRDTAGTGVPENLTAATARSVLNVEDGANAPPFVTGDYTDASVTYAKIQDVSAQWRVLGRISAGAGDVEEIDVSALTDQVSPAGGDLILAERASDGALVHIQVGNLPTGGGGEANLGSNLGAGVGVFEGKSGVTLQFRSLVSQTTALTIAEDAPNDEVDFTVDEATVSVAGLLSAADKTKLDNIDTSQVILTVRNSTGGTLTAGTPVYDNGFNVGQGLMEAAEADSAAAATMPAVGIVIADITNNTNGDVLLSGQLGSLDTSSFGDTDVLYIASGGGLTATRPTGSALVQKVASVLRSNVSTGEILVQGAGRSNDVPNFEQFSDQTSPVGTTKLLAETAAGALERVQIGNQAGAIDHDSLSGFIADEHVAHTSIILTAGDGLTGGGDISANRSFDVDINGTTDLPAPATGDELLLGDISNANAIRKADVASVVNLADHDALTNFIADEHVDHTTVSVTAGDGLTGGGDISATRTLDVDINGTADLAAPAINDEILIADTSTASAIRKADVASVVNLADHDALTNFVANEHVDHTAVTLTAGDALSGGGDISANRTFDLDINGTTDLAAPATGDELILGDISNANAIRKADVASVVNLADHDALTNFVADEHVAHGSVTLTAGDGLSGGGTIAANRTFNVDISGATDDAAPARSDEILIDDGAIKKSDIGAVVDLAKPVESFIIAASDEATALTTGTAKVTFRMPYAFTLSEVRASVTTAPTGSVLTVDINETGTTILSTKITIDATEKTSETAATAPVISDTSLADDAEITIDIDTVGSTVAGAGLKVTLIGNQT